MGSRGRERVRVIPAWTETIGSLIEEGAIVRAHCSECGKERLVDLQRIQRAKGPLYSLWLRTAPCRTNPCRGRVWFSAMRPDAGVWPTNMRNVMRHQVEPFHERWRASLTGLPVAAPTP
jgi:hypothetical protein